MAETSNSGIPSTSSSSTSTSTASSKQLQTVNPCRNLIHEIVAEPFQVHLRIRPLTSQEMEKNAVKFCHSIENNSLKVKTPAGLVHEFKFTNIFDVTCNQTEIFDGTTLTAINDVVDGQNHIVFSYGVTNSGKTHTMQGIPTEPGIIPRALEMLFRNISHRLCRSVSLKPQNGSVVRVNRSEAMVEKHIKDEVFGMGLNDPDAMQSVLMESINASIVKHSTFIESSSTLSDDSLEKLPAFRSTMDFVDDDFFCIFISYVEIYNEKVYDLLAPIKGHTRSPLNLQENRNLNLFVKGVREICVNSVDEALKLLVIGQQNLKVAATKLNYSSSRSHSVYTIKVLRTANILDSNSAKISQLCFCDLAGSERYTNTQSVGERLKEAGLINTSLLVLGRCITALRHNQLHPKEPALPIPFRESKLTRILQGFFTGKGKALMIVNISPCEHVINETYHVLRFSALAKEIVLPQNLDCLSNISKVTKLSLDLIRRSINGKESIDWASPGTSNTQTSSLSEYFIDSSSHEVKLNTTIDEEDESNSEENDIIDENLAKYWGIIQTLRDKLLTIHKEKAELEMRVRDEMGDTFLEILENNKERFSTRLAEQKEMSEELAAKRIQNAVDYYKTLVDEAKEEVDEAKGKVDELKEKVVALETALKSSEEGHQRLISEKEMLISELENKNKLMESLSSESEKRIGKLEKEQLQLKIQLKHVSRETQSSLYFSMINTGSSSSEGSTGNKEEYGNATVFNTPSGGSYMGSMTKSTSDDVFFKSPQPNTSEMKAESVKTLSTYVVEDSVRDQSAADDSVRDQSADDDSVRDQSAADDSVRDQSAADDSVRDQSAADDSVRDQSAADDSVRDQSAADDSVRDQSAADDSVRDQSAADDSVRDQSAADDSVRDQSAADDSVRDQSAADDSVRDQSAADDSVRDQSAADDSVRDQSAADDSVRDQSAADDSIVDQSVSYDYDDSSYIKMSCRVEDTFESRLDDDMDSEKETVSVVKLRSKLSQTELLGNEISFVEHWQDKLEENVTDLEEKITVLECANGLLKADVTHSKTIINDLEDTVRQLETKLQNVVKKSVLDASSQTDLTGKGIVETEEQLSKAETKDKENSNRIRLLKKKEIELTKEMEKLSSELALHDEKLQAYKLEKKTLEGKLVAETAKCNQYQQKLGKIQESKSVVTSTKVSDSDSENYQPCQSSVKPKCNTLTKKSIIVIEDSESSDEFMALRSRSKTASKRAQYESSMEEKKQDKKSKRVKVAKEQNDAEHSEEKKPLRPKVKKMAHPNQMLTMSPKKDVATETKSAVHNQVMRKLRARK